MNSNFMHPGIALELKGCEMTRQPSTKATIFAILFWGCACFAFVKLLTPLIGGTLVTILGFGAIFFLIPIMEMCQKYFDHEGS